MSANPSNQPQFIHSFPRGLYQEHKEDQYQEHMHRQDRSQDQSPQYPDQGPGLSPSIDNSTGVGFTFKRFIRLSTRDEEYV